MDAQIRPTGADAKAAGGLGYLQDQRRLAHHQSGQCCAGGPVAFHPQRMIACEMYGGPGPVCGDCYRKISALQGNDPLRPDLALVIIHPP